MSETRKQYSARRLRVRIERAKVAIMDVQEEISSGGFTLNPTALQQMTDAAFARLDSAWREVATIERAQAERADA